MNSGREALPWGEELWTRVDQAVHAENQRVGVAAKFVPLNGPMPNAVTVPDDVIDEKTMTVAEDAVLKLVELSVEFTLTPQQVAGEAELATAVTLSTRAASLLSQAEDLVIFQGDPVLDGHLPGVVRARGSAGTGLVAAASDSVQVAFDKDDPARRGERTVEAVAQAFSRLQQRGHYGPYALVLPTDEYAATFTPLPGTLILPADSIKGLVQNLYAAGTLPPATGVLVSVGGGTIDLVIGNDPAVAFMQVDPEGMYCFRVFERLALRVKDPDAIIQLAFHRPEDEKVK